MQLFTGSGGSTQTSNSNSSTSNDFAPWFDALTQQTVGNAQTLSNPATNPYPTYPTAQMFAPFQPAQQQAFSAVQGDQGAYQPGYTSANTTLGSGLSSANGYFNQAAQQPTALQAGQPYATAAGQTWNSPGVQSSYLNPYINSTVNAGNQLATQNFLQNTLPGINNEFVASGGGLGSSQYDNAAKFATTNFNNSLNASDQGALSTAYQGANNMFNADQSRLGALSGTVGNQAATSAGTLAGIGTAAGNVGIGGAGAYGSLAAGQSGVNLANQNALLQTGNQQQQQAQNPLTFNYQQFENAAQYPYQLTGWGANIAGGLSGAVPSSSNTNSTSTQTGSQAATTSPFGSLLGGLSAFQGLGGVSGISSLFSGLGGAAGGAGGVGEGLASLAMLAKRGGHFNTIMSRSKGYRGLDAPSTPSYYERFAPTQGRGGYWGVDAPSTPPTFRRGGHFNYAAGGMAPVVRAARRDNDRDIAAARLAQRQPQMGGLRRQLDTSTAGHFSGGGRSVPPAFMIHAQRNPGYFGRNA